MNYDDKIKCSLTCKEPNLNFSYMLARKVGTKWTYQKRDAQLADCDVFKTI